MGGCPRLEEADFAHFTSKMPISIKYKYILLFIEYNILK